MKKTMRKRFAAAAASGTVLCTALFPVFAAEASAPDLPDLKSQDTTVQASKQPELVQVDKDSLELLHYYFMRHKNSVLNDAGYKYDGYIGQYVQVINIYDIPSGFLSLSKTKIVDFLTPNLNILTRSVKYNNYNFYLAPDPEDLEDWFINQNMENMQ